MVYLSNYHILQGVPLLNFLVWGKPMKCGLQNLALKTTKTSLSQGAQHILKY